MTSTPPTLRIEKKLVAEGFTLAEVLAGVRRHPSAFCEVYPPRTVNNIYLDSPTRGDYHAHINGTAHRSKTRVRWYGQPFELAERPMLERKLKRGTVSGKQAYPLPPLSINGSCLRSSLSGAFDAAVEVVKARAVISALSWAILLSSASAEDWPQYLGPNRNSTSAEKGILRTWPEKGPEVLWTATVGRGYGGPVVKDGKVYLLDRDDKVGDKLRCFDFSNGKELWNFAYDAPGTVMFPGSRSVPTVDGKHVYTCGHNGDLYCFDLNTHKPVWNKNVWKDFGGDKIPFWAITQCPLVYGDLLIVASQAPEAGVVAYDKLTGDVKWKTPPLGLISYASPAIVKVDGKHHVVMVTSSTNPFQRTSPKDELGNIVGIEPLTGAILWKFEKWECHIPVASAVDADENQVLVEGGYELGALMIKVAQ